MACALLMLDRTSEALPLAEALAQAQASVSSGPDFGSVPGATTSITSSRGRSLLVETTALAALSWMQLARAVPQGSGRAQWEDNCHHAIRWISSQSEGGIFGSTQGTVLALKVQELCTFHLWPT